MSLVISTIQKDSLRKWLKRELETMPDGYHTLKVNAANFGSIIEVDISDYNFLLKRDSTESDINKEIEKLDEYLLNFIR